MLVTAVGAAPCQMQLLRAGFTTCCTMDSMQERVEIEHGKLATPWTPSVCTNHMLQHQVAADCIGFLTCGTSKPARLPNSVYHNRSFAFLL